MTRPSVEIAELTFDRLGQRGEGVARGPRGPVFVPYALPGDRARVEIDGDRARLLEVIEPSKDRLEPFCPHYGACGGCAVQTLAQGAYSEWKRGLVAAALDHARVKAEVAPLVDAHGAGRRRVTFHARTRRDALGRTQVECGFMRARAHDIVAIDVCPILESALASAPRVAHSLALALAESGKPLDILVTATGGGLDVDLRGCGPLDEGPRGRLIALAERLDLARLSNHGVALIERRAPWIAMGAAKVVPPPGAFLQATQAAEDVLAALVRERTGPARRIADLFAGIGTFALRLATTSTVHAVEAQAEALAALTRAVGEVSPALRPVSTETRDLMRRPLAPAELERFDAVVFDPPRAGAEAQARELAGSQVPVVVAVSCNAQTFARDAGLLVAGGYEMGAVTPVDQFRHAPHVELVAAFTKKRRRKGRLLG